MQSEDTGKIEISDEKTAAEMTVGAGSEPSPFSPQIPLGSQFHSDSETTSNDKEKRSVIVPDKSADSSSLHSEEEADSNCFKYMENQSSTESVRSWLQRITQMQTEIQKKIAIDSSVTDNRASSSSFSSRSRVVTYEDLPYMGEMTLDNSKPRRGRKPKKADICHLIYKNYGTVFPGAPATTTTTESSREDQKKSSQARKEEGASSPKIDVQNKIISSLLEKRLTQETRKRSVSSDANPADEPLNLCIKDLNHLKIRLLSKGDDIKSEPQSDDDVEFVNETSSLSSQDTDIKFGDLPPGENGVGPGGYVYWPNAGVFIHPMALQQQLMYYQRLAANNTYTLPSHSPKSPSSDSTSNKSKPIPELRKLAPKIRLNKEESREDDNSPGMEKPKRNAPSTSTDKTPTKRKRSAIFIPPIPAENQTNPATEVSICKFKFTGGAKPSLQEKKMLSVDSGGNFRYYSGTGDKSMRGYEFFPRETLQQQVNNAHGSSTGAFLQASGEKIYPPPVDFTGKQRHPELMLSPEIPATTSATLPPESSRHKKRKSRKSLQREKLEQTFKEKGFLIQTQQLESAEGATYCKFRQLRKFTRYLFRSWKDYLPGNVRELQEGEEDPEGDIDDLARFSSAEHVPTTYNATL